jgi:putative membrane protein
MNSGSIVLALHVLSNVVWIGSIAAVGVLVSKSADPELDAKSRAAVGAGARAIYRTLAAPAFTVSFVFGVALVARDPGGYFRQGWFHGKLAAALAVIAFHHVIGARSKRAAAGTLSGDGGARAMTIGLLVAAAAAVFFVIVRP